MELKVINEKGEAQASVPASEALFGRAFNEALIHQIVVAYNANGRSGTRQQKTRSEVRHSTRKPPSFVNSKFPATTLLAQSAVFLKPPKGKK